MNNVLFNLYYSSSHSYKTSKNFVFFFFQLLNNFHIFIIFDIIFNKATNTKKTIRKTYSEDEVDFFYTCFNGESYLIPIAEIAGKTTFRIRYEYPSNNQKQGIHLASDYELKNQISKIKGEVIK